MKFSVLPVWLFVCAGLVFDAGSARADDARLKRVQARLNGELRWAGDSAGGAPFVLADADDPNKLIGFEVELADALAKRLGVKARFVQFDWVNLIPGLDQSAFDVVINGLEMTPDRLEQVQFTRPYYVFQQQLVVRVDDNRIQSLEDCRKSSKIGGCVVGTLNGSAAEKMMNAIGDISVKGYDGQSEPYIDLARGRIDAVLLDWPIALYYGSLKKSLKFIESPPDKSYYGAAVRKADQELAAELDRALSEVMASGELRQIYQRWHMWNNLQVELVTPPAALRNPNFVDSLERQEAEGRAMLPPQTGEQPPADAIDIAALTASEESLKTTAYFPVLLSGALMTVLLTFTSFALAMLLGLIICTCRLYGFLPLRWFALGYIEFFRGIPLYLLLFFLYFGLGLPALATAICGFGMNYAAYEAEIYRSAILSVPQGQWDAARALAMPGPLTFRKIIFPQAIRTALAPMTNDFVCLFKDTALVSVIAVRELTKEYQILATSNPTMMNYIELGAMTAALYLIMSVPLGHLSRSLEKRWGAGA